MGGYILANNVGDIVAYSEAYIPNSIHINSTEVFNGICAAPYSFKWLNDQLVTTPRPSEYHKWTGTEWVIDTNYLDECRLAIWAEIKKIRDDRLEYGGFKVGTDWFHSDVYAQSNYTDLLMMGANIPANLMWKTMSGSFVLMNQSLAQQILAAKSTQKSVTFTKAEQHRAAVNASSDPLNYDYTTDWPLIYGE